MQHEPIGHRNKDGIIVKFDGAYFYPNRNSDPVLLRHPDERRIQTLWLPDGSLIKVADNRTTFCGEVHNFTIIPNN